MEKINLKDLEHIAIPEGLEERLSQRIDEWAAAERRRVTRRRLAIAAAACIALVIGFAAMWRPATEPQETEGPVEKLVVENKAPDVEKTVEMNPVSEDCIQVEAGKQEKESIPEFSPEVSPEENEEIERQMKILQAKIDNEIATQMAEVYLAEYYAQQIANGEEVGLPEIETPLGDDCIPMPNIMTLVME